MGAVAGTTAAAAADLAAAASLEAAAAAAAGSKAADVAWALPGKCCVCPDASGAAVDSKCLQYPCGHAWTVKRCWLRTPLARRDLKGKVLATRSPLSIKIGAEKPERSCCCLLHCWALLQLRLLTYAKHRRISTHARVGGSQVHAKPCPGNNI